MAHKHHTKIFIISSLLCDSCVGISYMNKELKKSVVNNDREITELLVAQRRLCVKTCF